MKEVFEAITQSLQAGQSIAVLTIVRASGSTPRHSSSNMLVRADGSFLGTIGGGTMERQAIRDAHAAIADRKPRLVDYNLNDRTPGSVGLCGGSEQIFIDVLLPEFSLRR